MIPEQGIPVKPLIYAFTNLLIFASLLFYFLKKPLISFLVARKKKVVYLMEESETYCSITEKEFHEFKDKLAKIGKEGQVFIDKVVEDSNASGKHMISEARKIAENISKDARIFVDAELEQAYKNLKFAFIDRVIDKADDSIHETAGEDARNRYLNEYSNLEKRLNN